jgi:hypothetical protein
MISAIRVEAYANDPAQAKHEIDTIITHLRTVGHYEGIVPENSHTKAEVYDIRKTEDYVRGDGGGRFWWEFEGRKVIEFLPHESDDFQPQRPHQQHHFAVALRSDKKDVTDRVIVLDRLLPFNWPQQFEPKEIGPDEIEMLLDQMHCAGMEVEIRPIPAPAGTGITVTATGDGYTTASPGTFGTSSTEPRWRVNVSYDQGRLGYHSVGVTILEAVRDAHGQATALGYPLGPPAEAVPA